MKDIIYISKLSKSFIHKDHAFSIFQDFNLQIIPNEFLVIFGPSGCGKSTLLNIISGTEEYSGKITGIKDIKHVGMVSQTSSLLPWLNVTDNVAFGLKLRGVNKIKRYQEAIKILEEMDLIQYSEFFPRQLSGGLSQLVSFARATACQADIMLMDEPFSSLDFYVLKIHPRLIDSGFQSIQP